jgi:DegV family protein with EDD domain
MNDYVITTDSSADLPESYLKEHGIGCAYLSYTMDGKNYTHEEFLPVKEFYDRIRAGSMPTTAQVNPGDIRELMEPYLREGKDILHIAFSSGLSGSYNSSRIAAQELREEYPERTIRVVDSLAASLGQGLLVHLCLQKKEKGEDLETVASYAEEIKNHVVHVFTVDDLEHLYRGGRVSKTAMVLGGMLNIKPMLHVDENGKLVAVGKVRGRKKSLLELVSMMDRQIGSYAKSCSTVFISHGDCEEDAMFVLDKVKEKYKIQDFIVSEVGSVIGAHSGPGTLALFFLGDKK